MPEWLIWLASIPLWVVVILVVRYGKSRERAMEAELRQINAEIEAKRKELGL